MQPDRCQPRKSVRRPAEQAFVHEDHKSGPGGGGGAIAPKTPGGGFGPQLWHPPPRGAPLGRLVFQKFAFLYSVGLMPVSFLKVPEK